MFELTNGQRRCLGLEETETGWERVRLEDDVYLYCRGNVIRKEIWSGEGIYFERSLEVGMDEARQMILPKTQRGKAVRLTANNLQKRAGYGVYFQFRDGKITLANVNTQITYYSSHMEGISVEGLSGLERWLDGWWRDTDAAELERIRAFAGAKRRHVRLYEGDFFRFKAGRRLYGYGRILLDVQRLRREKVPFWDIVMGKPLAVKVYHVLTEREDLPPEELRAFAACPSQYIFDNRFYYGEYEIVGNLPLEEEELDYPVMYGRSISGLDRDKIMFQWGPVYREIPCDSGALVPGDFRNNGVGFGLDVDRPLLEACIAAGSNAPYWDRDFYKLKRDLRSPANREAMERVLGQVGLEDRPGWMKNRV